MGERRSFSKRGYGGGKTNCKTLQTSSFRYDDAASEKVLGSSGAYVSSGLAIIGKNASYNICYKPFQ